MWQRIALTTVFLLALLPAKSRAEPTTQPTSRPALPHILVQRGGMLGSCKTEITPEGAFTRKITRDYGNTVETFTHTLTAWERQHVARIAQATLDTPSDAHEVTDYYQDITIGTFNVNQHGPDPRFVKLFDVLDRLEVIAAKEAR